MVTEGMPFYMASGITEVWVRLLYNSNEDISFKEFKPNSPFVLKGDHSTPYPNLSVMDYKNSIFIAEGIGIALCLSYFSSFPSHKIAQLFYVTKDEGINNEWLLGNQNTTIADDLNDGLIIDRDKMYYLVGSTEYINSFKKHLRSKKISNKNIVLIDYC